MFAGTSGFAYAGWIPRFYPPGLRGDALLRHYATRLPAVELNNTFYRQPRPEAVAGWLAATPPTFRFAVKAQRSGSLATIATDPEARIAWLTAPLRAFGGRLGTVLLRVPERTPVDLGRLDALLDAWPADLPLTLELPEAGWRLDEVHERLARHGTARCATDVEGADAPPLDATAPWLYLRLRRADYDAPTLGRWADRCLAFLDAGHDVYAFFRHDEVGRGAELALALQAAVESAGGRRG